MPNGIDDHLQHLRTVHFALILACAVLCIASFETLSSTRSLALNQLNAINNVLDTWDSTILQKTIRAVLDDIDEHKEGVAKTFVVSYGSPAHLLKIEYQPAMGRWLSLFDDQANLQGISGPLVTASSPVEPGYLRNTALTKPFSVEEFRKLWNALGTARVVYLHPSLVVAIPTVEEQLGWRTPSEMKYKGDLLTPPSSNAQDCGPPYFGPIPSQPKRMELAAACVDLSTGANIRISIPVGGGQLNAVDLGLQFQAAFRERYRVEWASGTFSDTFPALAQVPEELQQLPLEKLKIILQEEAKINTDRIEILGAKIPVTRLVSFGLPIILSLQAYMVLHLRGLRSALQTYSPQPIAWIGVYADRFSQVATAFTTSILPIFVVSWLFMLEFSRNWKNILVAVTVIVASAFMSTATLLTFLKLWRQWFAEKTSVKQSSASAGS